MRTAKQYVSALLIAGLLAGALLAAPVLAAQGEETPSVQEIVEKANRVAYYQGETGRARVKMTIYNAEGKVRGERELVILRRNAEEGLDQKFYAYFERPADVRSTVFLVWKNTEKDDDRWLYNPGLDLVNRISAADKRTSFVGTHFFYEDVSGRSIEDDEHELLRTTDNYYVLKNTPRDSDLVEFSYYEMYIHRGTFMPLHAFYYDKNGEKYREYHVLKMDKVDDYWTALKTEMVDLREQGPENPKTVAEYSGVQYGIELPDSIFTERYLRKPPREYLK
ncbi:MAG: outer membrane lipoprotein-sorting protein [Candidatus Brocadiia bacterium]